MQEKFLVYRLCFQEIIFSAVWAANRPESLILSCMAAYGASERARSIYPPWGQLAAISSGLVPTANSSRKNVQTIRISRIAGQARRVSEAGAIRLMGGERPIRLANDSPPFAALSDQNKHQRDNLCHSDIIGTLQGGPEF